MMGTLKSIWMPFCVKIAMSLQGPGLGRVAWIWNVLHQLTALNNWSSAGGAVSESCVNFGSEPCWRKEVTEGIPYFLFTPCFLRVPAPAAVLSLSTAMASLSWWIVTPGTLNQHKPFSRKFCLSECFSNEKVTDSVAVFFNPPARFLWSRDYTASSQETQNLFSRIKIYKYEVQSRNEENNLHF